MADLNPFIPFILKFETGTLRRPGESLESLFARATKTGFSADPHDLGGATMCGVTLATYTQYRKSIGQPAPTVQALKALRFSEWRDILKRLYWDRWHADTIPSQPVAELLVDWVWASGAYGIKLPQKVLGVTPDGIAGPKTMQALIAASAATAAPRHLFARLQAERLAFIDRICVSRPANKKFKAGWVRRVKAITYQ